MSRKAKRSAKGEKGHGSSVSPEKAKKILRDGEVKGHELTKPQRGFFGARAGGQPVKGKRRRL